MKWMLVAVSAVVGFASGLAFAQVPRLVHYQGVLKQSDGQPFDGQVDLHFNLYDRPRARVPIWSETHRNVTVTDGRYEVLLGSENPLALSFYEYVLEVRPEGFEGGARRVTIVGSGYTFRLWFLFAAYTVVWLAIFLYLLSISRRQRKIIAELEALAQTARH